MTLKAFAFVASCCLLTPAVSAADAPWAPWVEPDFPFFSSSFDLRAATPKASPMNIAPRGLVLNLGHDCWACFDTDLLRVAAIWTGHGVTDDALAQLSYQNRDLKTVGGQSRLPKPDGPLWMVNGIYPGWQIGEQISLDDPREPQPSKEEPGRGPLPAEMGRFKAVRHVGGAVVLEYTVAGAVVQEWMTTATRGESRAVQRSFRIAPSAKLLNLVVAQTMPGEKKLVGNLSLAGSPGTASMEDQPDALVVHVPPHETSVEFSITLGDDSGATFGAARQPVPATDGAVAVQRWPQEVTTKAVLSPAQDAYVVDDIPLPLENPWRRNVRLCDVAFFKDGTAAGVTVDGDVWMIRGLRENLGEVRWKRFASGLHEPMGLVIRDEQIFVFDRNGIWRLRDTNGDGEADVHELFSNVFPQSAESREFPNSIKLAPDGSFVIAKGGQQASTVSRLNGSVLRVAPDGQSFTVLGHGFRQPFAGVNPRTGAVTASDQEGNYTPTTPLHLLQKDEFHGFLSELLPKEKYPEPIADPLTWIPHQINPSAASQVWLFGARMGPLNDALIHVGFNRPELFRVLLNERFAKPQAAVVSVVRDFDVPVLNATLNPVDGWLYLAGFQVIGWGTTAKRISAFARTRYTGAACTLPREVVPMDKGVLLRFDVALDPKKAADPASYSIESWHYQRTYKYGSPHLKADGTPGQDWITPSSAYLAKDGKSVFVGVPQMTPVMQMRIGWSLATADGGKAEENAYFTPYELAKFDPVAEGFGNIAVDLTPRAAVAQTSAPASAEEGRRLYQLMGCMACHATDDSVQPKIGPSWKGLYGKERELAKAPTTIADEAYIRESILSPAAKVVKGYEKVEAGMPVYAGVLSDPQIESLILFIKTLR
jgi:glucose/arabinose dehydrogenase/cytochrome c2